MEERGKSKIIRTTIRPIYNYPVIGGEVTRSDGCNSLIGGATYNLDNKKPKAYGRFSNRWIGSFEVGYDFGEWEGRFSFKPSRLLKIIGYSTPLIILGSLVLYSLAFR